MPLFDSLAHAINKATDKIEDAVHKQATRPQVPYHSKPNAQQPVQGGHGPHRTPYWHPEFTPSTPLNQHFRHETGATGWGNSEAQNYTDSPDNSFFSPSPTSNAVHITAVADCRAADNKYTSARLTSHQTLSRSRGALSARITAPIAKGVWPAFWLLPKDPFSWPTDGEVDIFEAWDGAPVNHSCLHWGHFNGQDWNKHRVIETDLPGKIDAAKCGSDGRGVFFELVWDESPDGKEGKLVWYLEGRPVMKAAKPAGIRSLKDFRIIANVALGGNVCKGRLPDDGRYEMIISELAMWDEPVGGWAKFERDWREAGEGHT